MAESKPSKLAYKIAKAFSSLKPELQQYWQKQEPLPSGMNWAVRMRDGLRQIAVWRTAQQEASDIKAQTMATHASFVNPKFERVTNSITGITAIIISEGLSATDNPTEDTPPWVINAKQVIPAVAREIHVMVELIKPAQKLLADLRRYLLETAKTHNYPQITFRPGSTIPEGREVWEKFVSANTESMLKDALAVLEQLAPEWHRIPTVHSDSSTQETLFAGAPA